MTELHEDLPLAPGSLSGKTALVTGSSRGIGADTVRYLAQAGANVVINYRNKAPRAEKLATELRGLGVQVLVVGADLTDTESVQAMFSEVERTFGSLDVLVLNASGGMTLNFSRQRFDRSQPANSFLSATTRTQLLENRVTASYAISWDISRSYVVSQGIIGSYMAQCCGIQGEFQQFNYPSGFGLPINADRRINFSFVLAGLGTFSNFFGAFGGG